MKYLHALRSFVVVGLSIVVLQLVGWTQPVQVVVRAGVAPVQLVSVQILQTLSAPVLSVPRWYRSQQRLEELQKNYAELQAQASQVERLERENEQLRTLLESSGARQSILAAPIVSYALPTIAAGSEHGVKPEQVVLSNGVLLGRVSSVSERMAQVVLLSSKQAEPILAETETGVQGLVQGTGSQVVFTQVQVADEVPFGSTLTAVGQPGIPPGAYLGTTANSVSRPSAPVQTFSVDQVVSFYSSAVVEVE